MSRPVRSCCARSLLALSALALVAHTSSPAQARVKLITLPVRERVEIQLDNPHATLVEEERIVPLVAGENQVDFSWANTQIDAGTIVFRVIAPEGDDANEVKVVSVSYPPGEAALVWTVGAKSSGSARVRISYLLGNLTKSFNYRAVASSDEHTLDLAEYMRLQNLANEEFGSTGLWAGFGDRFLKPIGVNETKEMLVERFRRVPIQKTYTCNPQEFEYLDRAQNKLRLPMHYVLKNDAEHGLGAAPLPFGKVRIFIEGAGENAAANTAFLGEDWGQFTPKDDEMRLYLGVAQDIAVKRTIAKNEAKHIAGNLFNYEVIIQYEIENFKDEAVTLDVAESLPYIRGEVRGNTGRDVEWEIGSDTTFEGQPDPEHSAFDKLLYHVKLPAARAGGKAEKITHKLHLILKNEW